MIVAVVPALNESATIGEVVRGLLAHVDVVIVSDNGSTDATAARAREAGADIVSEPRRGYGFACHAGIARAHVLGARVVVLCDADGSDDPADVPLLLEPLQNTDVDLVLGVRTPGSTEPGAMAPVQRFGNWLAPRVMRLATGARYSDMPPFKAIRLPALLGLALQDTGHGFTVELLLKAHARRLKVKEVVVRCRRRRGGASKVSGTLGGTLRATVKIVTTIGRHAWAR